MRVEAELFWIVTATTGNSSLSVFRFIAYRGLIWNSAACLWEC
jgi:hypothetical protein